MCADDEAATAIGDVFTSLSEQLDEFAANQRGEFALQRGEFSRLLNIHTGIRLVALAVASLVIAVALFG